MYIVLWSNYSIQVRGTRYIVLCTYVLVLCTSYGYEVLCTPTSHWIYTQQQIGFTISPALSRERFQVSASSELIMQNQKDV